MKPSRLPLLRAATASAMALISSSASLFAADAFWDSNGATAGTGATPTGTWGTSAFWSTSSAGTAATTATWTDGDVAVFSAGTQAVNAFTVTLSGARTIGGLTVEEGTPTISGGTGLALNNAATPFAITSSAVVSSVISGTGFGISKTGVGILTLSGANTFTGSIDLSGGTLAASMGNGLTGPLGSTTSPAANSKLVTITNNAVFRSLATWNNNSGSATVQQVVFKIGSGGGTFDTPSGTTMTLDDGSTTGTANNAAQLQGDGNLTKTGAGTLSLGNAATNFSNFTGQILVNAGILRLGAVTTGVALGSTSAGTVIASGAGLDVTNHAGTAAEPLTISGAGVGGTGNVIYSSNTSGGSFSGPITLAANSTIGAAAGTVTLAAGATVDLGSNTLTIRNITAGAARVFTDGVISGAGSLVMNSAIANGDYVPRADHTYSGGTTLTLGLVAVDRDSIGAPGSPTSGPFGTGVLNLAGGQLRSGTGPAGGRLVGNPVTISANTTFYATGGEKNLTFTGPVTLSGGNRTITANAGTTVTGVSTIFTGAIGEDTAGRALIKAGTGNLTLGGANTYSGGTTVNEGTLILTGSILAGTPLTVSPSTAAGAVFSLVSGSAAPQGPLSTLALGSATGPVGIALELGANAASSDSISASGASTATGAINFRITALPGFGTGSFPLLSAPSGLVSGAPTYSIASAPGGYTYSLSVTDSQVSLNVNPAPSGDLYWKGAFSNSWASISGSDSNWTTDAAGTTNAQSSPSAANTVNFSAASTASTAITTTLDNNYTVAGLAFSPSPAGVTAVSIAPGVAPSATPGTLTITPSSASTGLTLAQGSGAVTISAPVVLGADQTWSVDGSTPTSGTASSLTVSGAISSLSATPLTFTSTVGSAPIILAGAGSSYTGASTVSADTVVQGGATNAFSSATSWTVNGTLNTGAFGQSTGSLVGGAGTVQNGSATNVTLTLGNDNLPSATFSGPVQNGSTGTLAITKNGTGTQVLTNNSYTGNTTVANGTLTVSGARAGAHGAFSVGTVAGQNATLNITAGSFALGASAMNIGNNPTTAGIATVNQSAGDISFTSGNALLLGQNTVGNQGIYNLSGGSITTFASTTRGVMLGVNSNPAPGTGGGTFNLSGTGVLNMTAASGGGGDAILQIGRSDTTAINTTNLFSQTGGTANVGILSVGGGSTSTGVNSTLSLTGGTFAANQFTVLAAGAGSSATINIGGTADVTLPAFPTARGAGAITTLALDGGTLRPAAASATYISGLTNAFIKAGGANFNIPVGRNITVSQALLTDTVSTGGGLAVSGGGVLTLSGANTYTGSTTVAGSGLIVKTLASLPGFNTPHAVQLDGSSTLTLGVGGAGEFTSADVDAVLLNVDFNTGAILGFDTTNATTGFTYASNIGNASAVAGTALGLAKLGANTLVLSGNNTFSGPVTISAGVLQVTSTASLGDGSATNTLNMSGGVFSSGLGTVTLGASRVVNITAAAGFRAESGASLAIDADLANGANSIALTGAGAIVVNGVIGAGATPTGALTIGSSTLPANVTLNGNNLFTGNVSLPAANTQPFAVLTLTNSGSLGVGPKTVTSTGGGEIHLQNNITIASGINFTTSGSAQQNNVPGVNRPVIINDSGSNTINGNITMTSGNGSTIISSDAGLLTFNGNFTATQTLRQLQIRGNGDGVINGVISNGSTVNLPVLKDGGTGTWTLTGLNTYTGGTSIAAGTLSFANGSLGSTGAVSFTGSSTLRWEAGNTQDVSSRISAIGAGITATFDTNGNTLALASALSGAGAIAKTGLGELTLGAANAHSGGTTVAAGSLLVGNASALGTGAATVNGGSLNLNGASVTNSVTVAGGALDLGGGSVSGAVSIGAAGTLTGSGSVTGAASLAGVLAPGGSGIGLVTLASPTVATTSSIELRLANVGTRGTDFDALNVSGALALDGTITVTAPGLVPAAGQSFDLIDSTGSIDVTSFDVNADLVLPSLSAGLAWDRSAFASTGVISIVTTGPTLGAFNSSNFTLEEQGNPAISGPAADPDGDGVSNVLEYAFAANPKAASRANLPVSNTTVSSGSTYVGCVYTRVKGATDLAFTVQFSSTPDSSGFTDAVAGVDYTLVSTVDNGSTETITIRDNTPVSPSVKRFVRILVTYP